MLPIRNGAVAEFSLVFSSDRNARNAPPTDFACKCPVGRGCIRVGSIRHDACSGNDVRFVPISGEIVRSRTRRAMVAGAVLLTLGAMGGCDRVEYRQFAGDTIRSGWVSAARPSTLRPATAQRDFLRTASEAGLFEIEASRIAIARGGSPAVRRFAEATLRDRVSIDTDLQQLAESVGVQLPSQLNSTMQARLAVLATLTGNDFDRAYARNVGIMAQEEALLAFERAANEEGERIERFAASQLPTLRKHLEWARQLAAELDRTSMA